GLEWATCVERFYDFESKWDISDEGRQVPTGGRPKAVGWWLGRARQWQKFVGIGETGSRGKENTYAGAWWDWWGRIQPAGWEWVDGTLAMPTDAEWGLLARYHGKNGMLHVMASLLWWGDKVGKGKDPMAYLGWTTAVGDVSGVLHEL
ncbi:hypothetical protein C8R43DRAFT_851676, partial [Mycena crocata]